VPAIKVLALACVRPSVLEEVEARIATVGNELGIEGFARIDAFINVDSGEVMPTLSSNYLPRVSLSSNYLMKPRMKPRSRAKRKSNAA